MYYLVYLTEGCNLACTYCDPEWARERFAREVSYDVGALERFLAHDPDVALQFYGGEPLMRVDLLREVLARVKPKHVVLQTNGMLLDRLDDALLERLDVISVSLDGPEAVTDRARGAGVYRRVLDQLCKLHERGFAGRIDARMTVSPGTRTFEAVHHLASGNDFPFSRVYWQLNVLFHAVDWRQDRKVLRHWIDESYNPDVTRLVDWWASELDIHERVVGLVPFAALTHAMITETPARHVRCGAGTTMWTVSTDGQLFACPIMRAEPALCAGTLTTHRPETLEAQVTLGEPCTSCEIRETCGGRCLVANRQQRWGDEGFALVCSTVKHLVRELERVKPRVRTALARGKATMGALDLGLDYEVIP